MSFDPRCYDLAELFLSDEPAINTREKRDELAQIIQDAVEDFIAYERDPSAGDELITLSLVNPPADQSKD